MITAIEYKQKQNRHDSRFTRAPFSMSLLAFRRISGVLQLFHSFNYVRPQRYSARPATTIAPASAVPYRVWSKQEDETLRLAIQQGHTSRQCLELLPGRTLRAISGRRVYYTHHWQRSSTKPKSKDVIEIVRLARQGLGKHEIHKKMPHRSVTCLLYTSPSPRDGLLYRMPSSA